MSAIVTALCGDLGLHVLRKLRINEYFNLITVFVFVYYCKKRVYHGTLSSQRKEAQDICCIQCSHMISFGHTIYINNFEYTSIHIDDEYLTTKGSHLFEIVHIYDASNM